MTVKPAGLPVLPICHQRITMNRLWRPLAATKPSDLKQNETKQTEAVLPLC